MAMVKKKEDITNITGTNYLVYVLWGESPEWADYHTYGFETEREQHAFLVGIDEGEGWMGYMTGSGHNTDKKALEYFEADMRSEHPDLFKENKSVESS